MCYFSSQHHFARCIADANSNQNLCCDITCPPSSCSCQVHSPHISTALIQLCIVYSDTGPICHKSSGWYTETGTFVCIVITKNIPFPLAFSPRVSPSLALLPSYSLLHHLISSHAQLHSIENGSLTPLFQSSLHHPAVELHTLCFFQNRDFCMDGYHPDDRGWFLQSAM